MSPEDEVAAVRQLQGEVTVAQAKAKRLTASAVILACLCVLSALVALLLVLRVNANNKNENGRKIAALSLQLKARDDETAQRLDCQQRFDTATQSAFAEYQVALGDLIVSLVTTTTPDRATVIQARVDALNAALIEFRTREQAQFHWDVRTSPLPCPIEPTKP